MYVCMFIHKYIYVVLNDVCWLACELFGTIYKYLYINTFWYYM